MSSLPVAWYVISILVYVYYTYGDLFKKTSFALEFGLA